MPEQGHAHARTQTASLRRRRARPGPVGVVALTAAAACCIALAACGSASNPDSEPATGPDDNAVETRIARERAEAAEDARQQQQIKDLKARVHKLDRERSADHEPSAPAQAASSSQPATPSPPPSPSFSACDSNISVSGAGCSFANNVFWEYWTSGQASSLSVYDPSSGQFYATSCDGYSTVECQTARGAAVRFPQAAVDVYSQTSADRYAATHDTGH